MTFDIASVLRRRAGENLDLHRAHVNPQFARVLRTIGFDRCYVRAQGPYLWDAQGRQYLDFLGGYSACNLGRNHPVVRRALREFLECDYPSLVQMDAPLLCGVLAEDLKRRMPCAMDYVFFTNSGTEGVEAAIKFARCATGRSAVLHAGGAFHGLSCGSLSLNGSQVFREGFGPLLPQCRQIPFGDLTALEEALAPGDVAALILEPIQGKGVNLPPSGYLEAAAALCRRHGALFVADEVQTGVGRTGSFLAIEQEGAVEPDMVILAKSLSGGYVPVGAVLARRAVWERVFSSMSRAVVHSSTFHQGSMAMVAALATLHVYDSEDLGGAARRMGGLLKSGLDELRGRFELIHDVRQRGLMIGIEFGRPASRRLRLAWDLTSRLDANLFPQAVVMPLLEDHGILTQVAGHRIPVIKLLPPLVIGEEDVRRFLRAFESVMESLHRFPGPAWEAVKRLGRHALARPSRAPAAGAAP
jgi:acetylornithine/succinyldiaminopimelate/putrescine aminotransferase